MKAVLKRALFVLLSPVIGLVAVVVWVMASEAGLAAFANDLDWFFE